MRCFGKLWEPTGKTKNLLCPVCGKAFEVYSTMIGRKYCSNRCKNIGNIKYSLCTSCHSYLSDDERKATRYFYKEFVGLCNKCYQLALEERREEKRSNLKSIKLLKDGLARCSKCGEIKNISLFYKSKSNPNGLHSMCKECTKVHLSKYGRSQNYKSLANHRRRIMYANDSKYRLNNRLRKNISRTIVEGSKNGRHWETLVGYSIDKLMRHLEKQFDGEMSWENYGIVWHIDHIVPLSALNFEKPEDRDFKIAWGLKNLRPLMASDNLRKGKTPLSPVQRSIIFNSKMGSK